MKLHKIEGQYSNGNLYYRYFEYGNRNQQKSKQHGYQECLNSLGKKQDRRYWVNGEEIGFELWVYEKYYNI